MAKEMTAGNSTEKKGFGARFMDWYGSYQGKRVVGMVYSIGASVVQDYALPWCWCRFDGRYDY